MHHSFEHKRILPFTLVLGGGGARGLAHIGILKAFEQIGLLPSLIVGTSMGALIGGMYSQLGSAKKVEEKLKAFFQSKFFQQIGLEQFSNIDENISGSAWERFTAYLRQRFFFSKSVLGSGMFAQATLLHSMHILLQDQDILHLPIRLAAVACDLTTGEEFIFTSGSLVTAVAASSAVPGIVAPLIIGSRFYIDGTVTSTIPVTAARSLSANRVIAVDVRRSLNGSESIRHGYETIIYANEITSRKLNDTYLRQADIVLAPVVTHIDWNEFHQFDYCIQAGEQAVERTIEELTCKLTKPRFSFFHRH
jgi:NTE family protein